MRKTELQQVNQILQHYFQVAWKSVSPSWQDENTKEIEELAKILCQGRVNGVPGNGECICRMSPEKREEYAKRHYYSSWSSEDAERPGNLIAVLDHRCPKHGERAQPKLWGRHEELVLEVTAQQWYSLGVAWEAPKAEVEVEAEDNIPF